MQIIQILIRFRLSYRFPVKSISLPPARRFSGRRFVVEVSASAWQCSGVAVCTRVIVSGRNAPVEKAAEGEKRTTPFVIQARREALIMRTCGCFASPRVVLLNRKTLAIRKGLGKGGRPAALDPGPAMIDMR